MNMVALIPARAGSKRIPGKNMKLLGGKPLIQWTIEAAHESKVFEHVCVFTESQDIADVVISKTRCDVRKRSEASATDDAPDILWVREALDWMRRDGITADAFAILRPTSPFRTADTIRRAFLEFDTHVCDSMRAIQPVKEHPMKMWRPAPDGFLDPVFRAPWETVPYHSRPTQTLPPFYVQNASLEMAWTRVVTEGGSISGQHVWPFFTKDDEGFDINTPEDWAEAENIVARKWLGDMNKTYDEAYSKP